MLSLTNVAAADGASLVHAGPNDRAPEAVKQFGQLEGHWSCTAESPQADGTWKRGPGTATWSWYYVLEGYAVQDVWMPDRAVNPQAPMGTNLRTFDPATGMWDIVWATQQVPAFDRYRAAYRNGEIHMYAERPAAGAFPSHLMHVTFPNISDKHFDWRYEASGLTDGQSWAERSRLSCDRT